MRARVLAAERPRNGGGPIPFFADTTSQAQLCVCTCKRATKHVCGTSHNLPKRTKRHWYTLSLEPHQRFDGPRFLPMLLVQPPSPIQEKRMTSIPSNGSLLRAIGTSCMQSVRQQVLVSYIAWRAPRVMSQSVRQETLVMLVLYCITRVSGDVNTCGGAWGGNHGLASAMHPTKLTQH